MGRAETSKSLWSILYRGPLSSCNYGCDYCPFAKTRDTREQLAEDARQLARFVSWVGRQRDRRVRLLFTPWGEALIRKPYQRALASLSQMAHVERAAIQTNLSGPLEWMSGCDLDALALWTTYHPTQIALGDFVAKCHRLDAMGVRYSVGVVGLRHELEAIARLRGALHPGVYMWINAYKREPDYYDEALVRALEQLDPLFRYNTRYHESEGHACQAGATSFTVDGRGDVRRCHFIDGVLGNIYEPDFRQALKPTPCGQDVCGCHIGYVHMDRLGLSEVFGRGVMERIPSRALWQRDHPKREEHLRLTRAELGPHVPAQRPSWA